jgi:hypothetical protein
MGIVEFTPRQLTPTVGIATTGFRYPAVSLIIHQHQPDRICIFVLLRRCDQVIVDHSIWRPASFFRADKLMTICGLGVPDLSTSTI